MLIRLVLDTNVVVSGLLWGGVPGRLLRTAREQHISLYTSTPLLTELADILSRGKFEKKIAASGYSVEQLVERYILLAAPVRPTPIPRTVRDQDDDVVLATALAARADLIATGDKDLLSLHPWQGVQVLNAADALQRLLEAMTAGNKYDLRR